MSLIRKHAISEETLHCMTNISAACLCFDASKYVTGMERIITLPEKVGSL